MERVNAKKERPDAAPRCVPAYRIEEEGQEDHPARAARAARELQSSPGNLPGRATQYPYVRLRRPSGPSPVAEGMATQVHRLFRRSQSWWEEGRACRSHPLAQDLGPNRETSGLTRRPGTRARRLVTLAVRGGLLSCRPAPTRATRPGNRGAPLASRPAPSHHHCDRGRFGRRGLRTTASSVSTVVVAVAGASHDLAVDGG